jgi:hypothetical protein
METGPINIYNSKRKAVGPARKSCGDREIIYGVVGKFQAAVVPGSGDTSGGAIGRFENEGTDFWREEGGGEEGGDVIELGFLKEQDRGGILLDRRPDIVTFLAHAEPTDVPAINNNFV